MIISRTPFRISFFGGGTDYPVWCREHGGAVLSTTIDKYCYISCRVLPPFFEHHHRIVYSKIETIRDSNDIVHPAVREVFKFMKINEGLEIHHDGDLPARSGLGSSSSFTVGLLHALHALRGGMVSKEQLAFEAIHVEQDLIRENVGAQDQIAASFGGLNKIVFNPDDTFEVLPVILNRERIAELQSHIMLIFTGFTRMASEIAHEQVQKTKSKKSELSKMLGMVDEAIAILSGTGRSMKEFGQLLHETWLLKRSLTDKISNTSIDSIYEKARDAGAIGGKILGAGGGGFLLLFVDPEKRDKVRKSLDGLLEIPFCFERNGSQIIVYRPDMIVMQ